MGFVYSGCPYADSSSVIASRAALCDLIKNNAVSSGWTSANKKYTIKLVYTGQPSNGQSFVVNSVTYTFRTVINNGVFG